MVQMTVNMIHIHLMVTERRLIWNHAQTVVEVFVLTDSLNTCLFARKQQQNLEKCLILPRTDSKALKLWLTSRRMHTRKNLKFPSPTGDRLIKISSGLFEQQ